MSETEVIGAKPDVVPAMLGKYRVYGLLGRGAVGSIYHCIDDGLGREVAVKVLDVDRARDPNIRQRFEREGKALARVKHACVVQVFDIGECDLGPFIVMELVKGEN